MKDLLGRATADEQALAARRDHRQRPPGCSRRAGPGGVARPPRAPRSRPSAARPCSRAAPCRSPGRRSRARPPWREFGLEVGRPVLPMLASSAPDVAAAMAKAGGGAVAIDTKLDGIRIQVHKAGDDVLIATRSLDVITDRLPEVVDVVRALPAERLVLDGEALALADDGRPRPFQETASRTAMESGVHVTPYFFDLLHLDGTNLLDRPRHRALGRARRPRARAAPHAQPGHRRPRAGRGVRPRDARPRPRRRGREVGRRRRTTPAVAAPPGSRSSRCTPSTSSCWPSSGAAAGARGGCPTSTSAPATRRRRRLRDARQDVQGDDRRDARAGRPSGSPSWRSSPRPIKDHYVVPVAPRAGRRDRLRRPPALDAATPVASPCASPGSSATATTRPPTRPTPWPRSRRCSARR